MSQTACERGLSPQSARKPLALAHPITCANRAESATLRPQSLLTVSSRSRSELPISKLTGDLTRD